MNIFQLIKVFFLIGLFVSFSETAQARINPLIEPRPGFSFDTALEGTVQDFARGESFAERKIHFREDMIRRYSASGSEFFTPEETTIWRQDFNSRELLLIHKYDPKNHDNLGQGQIAKMKQTLYDKRFLFMKSFDKNNDGYLDRAETAAMRLELAKRHAAFVQHFDRA